MDLSKKETCPLAFFRFTVCVFFTSELKTRVAGTLSALAGQRFGLFDA